MKLRLRPPEWSTYTGALGSVLFVQGRGEGSELQCNRLLRIYPGLVEVDDAPDKPGSGDAASGDAGAAAVGARDEQQPAGGGTGGDEAVVSFDSGGAGAERSDDHRAGRPGDDDGQGGEAAPDQPAAQAGAALVDAAGSCDDRPARGRRMARHPRRP